MADFELLVQGAELVMHDVNTGATLWVDGLPARYLSVESYSLNDGSKRWLWHPSSHHVALGVYSRSLHWRLTGMVFGNIQARAYSLQRPDCLRWHGRANTGDARIFSWSPTGLLLVMYSQHDGLAVLALLDESGNQVSTLHPRVQVDLLWSGAKAWSPSGTALAFTAPSVGYRGDNDADQQPCWVWIWPAGSCVQVSTSCAPMQGLAWDPLSRWLILGQSSKGVQIWRQGTQAAVYVALARSEHDIPKANQMSVVGFGAGCVQVLHGRSTCRPIATSGYKVMVQPILVHNDRVVRVLESQPRLLALQTHRLDAEVVFEARPVSRVSPKLSPDKELCLAVICDRSSPQLSYELTVIRLRSAHMQRYPLQGLPKHLAWAPDSTAILVIYATKQAAYGTVWNPQPQYLLIQFVV